MTIYINIKTAEGVETIDEVRREDFKTFRDFKAELRNVREGWSQAGAPCYTSRRCTREWRAKG